MFRHPANLSNLSTTDYYLFANLQQCLRGHGFLWYAEVKAVVHNYEGYLKSHCRYFFFSQPINTGKKKSMHVNSPGNSLFFDIIAVTIKAFIIPMYKQFNTTSIEIFVQIFQPCIHSNLHVFIADKSLMPASHCRYAMFFEQRYIFVIH